MDRYRYMQTYSDVFVNFGLFDCSAIKNKPVQVSLLIYIYVYMHSYI